ncbi:MAG: imidazole glycerol phosphate synthase subunit HisH [candidate division FCPU426 bacterium]
MKTRIGILDYGRGNLRSVAKALEAVGAEALISDSPRALDACKGLLVPGVGAFGDCMASLKRRGMVTFLKKAAKEGRPMLGVCLGEQLFCESSSEFGRHEGLGFFDGKVARFKKGLKVPHMGWNQVRFTADCPLLRGLKTGSEFYFVHSYRVRLRDRSAAAGTTRYGSESFDSVLWKGNLFATQFHPEKSQRAGLRLYKNYWDLVQAA